MLSENDIFLNASGCWCADEEQINSLFDSNLDAILIKTCTFEPKEGNKEPNYYKLDDIHINSKGLPNNGYLYYKKLYDKFCHLNKKFILSVAWENNKNKIINLLEDYDNHILKKELVELNLSCPNVEKSIPSYDPFYFESILHSINNYKFKNLFFFYLPLIINYQDMNSKILINQLRCICQK